LDKTFAEAMASLDATTASTDAKSKDVVVRAPFGYPGGKSRSVNHILPHLPQRDVYIEPFGGSGAVLLARQPSKLEVLNDRYSGVTSFYRVIRDPRLLDQFCERVELAVHSREEFVWCKETWKNVDDHVERAARWFYMIQYSFSQLGRNFGRSTSAKSIVSGKMRNRIKEFPFIHQRLHRVQVENQDWYDCMIDYDSPGTVFYVDPPYVDASPGIYEHELTPEQHRALIDTIFRMKGFVAVSGYANPLYDSQPWDHRHTWKSFVSMQSLAHTEGNNKAHMAGIDKRGHADEMLWIKESLG
jgi:DNA adenine methylase